MSADCLLAADRVWLGGGRWLAPGAVLVRAGLVEAVGSPRELADAARSRALRTIDLPGCVLLPGLVNAHAHLELSFLRGRTARGGDFAAWIRDVVRLRAESSPAELERATLQGARLALAGGATTVGDFDATGAAERALSAHAGATLPRVVTFRELLDARQAARTESELRRMARPWAASELVLGGLAPHAPHTVSARLCAAIARAAREEGRPVATHWSETADEVRWLEQGGGPFDLLLGASPRRSGLDLLADAGLLGPGLSLVHGNQAREDERRRIARAGAVLVHCPGTHAFFERALFPWREWRAAAVDVALGTDSLASNDALDLRREMGRLRAAHPQAPAAEVLDAATVHGARALGLAGRVGRLAPKASADILAVQAAESDASRLAERLARGEFEVHRLWLRGGEVAIRGLAASAELPEAREGEIP